MLPISLATPTIDETGETAHISTLLAHVCETKSQLRHRKDVLNKLNKILQVWVKYHGGSMELYPFGSYALGVQSPQSDIDVLMCSDFPRKYIFQDLGKVLELHPDLANYSLVTEAFTPVIKFTLEGIDIDLIYSQVPDPSDLSNPGKLSSKDNNSLNGYRVNNAILNIVPNLEAFRITLRFIKLWAKNRFIYSNIMGYLGGISWAILVSHVCLLYPNATASVCIAKFFQFYSLWDGKAQITISDARLERPNSDLLKILTPVSPCMNSSHNVTVTTWRVMQKEILRGHRLAEQKKWSLLLKKRNFFKCQTYLGINVTASTKGFIESRLRYFFAELEKDKNIQVIPYPHCIQYIFFIGIKGLTPGHVVDARPAIQHLRRLLDISLTIKVWTKSSILALRNETPSQTH